MTHTPSGPCLLWTIPNGSSAGNMLRTGVLARVLDYVADARVVLMSPLAADPAFTREFKHPRVAFEPLPPHVPAGVEAKLLGIFRPGTSRRARLRPCGSSSRPVMQGLRCEAGESRR